jgi:hypothetical protein
MIESLRSKVRNALPKNGGGRAMHHFSEDVFCIKEVDTSELSETRYEPALCVILQGAKQTNLGDRILELSAGDSVILIEAHTLLSSAGYSVSDAAFIVGDESANHFSRDYSKKFGFPPKEAKAIAT